MKTREYHQFNKLFTHIKSVCVPNPLVLVPLTPTPTPLLPTVPLWPHSGVGPAPPPVLDQTHPWLWPATCYAHISRIAHVTCAHICVYPMYDMYILYNNPFPGHLITPYLPTPQQSSCGHSAVDDTIPPPYWYWPEPAYT